MAHTLRVFHGHNPGEKYALAEDEIVVGRAPECHIAIDSKSVSRRHARLMLEEDRYAIEDLRSRNGTCVNGQRISGPVLLDDGDRVSICETVFVFRSSPPVAHPSADDSGESVVCAIDAMGSSTVVEVNAEARLRAVLKINQLLGPTLHLGVVLSKMLDGLFEIFPQADRGLVLLCEGNRLIPKAAKQRHGKRESIQYSRTIVDNALAGRRVILSEDLARDQEIPPSGSITELQMRSVMCVPLLAQETAPLGVIQLDTQESRKRFNADDVRLLTSVAAQVSMSVEYAQLHRQMIKHARLERELELARAVQLSFLPGGTPDVPGYRFWVYYQTASLVGGDFYDFRRLPNGNQAVLLGDIAGKGIPAALMMAKVSTFCKMALLSHSENIADAMAAVNKEVCDAGAEVSLATLGLCVLDPATHEVTVASAGHMSPMIVRNDGTIHEPAVDSVRGYPLGVEAGSRYPTDRALLAPGEIVVLFSDGISEAMSTSEERYSIQRIRGQLARTKAKEPAEIGQALLDDVQRHVAGYEQNDDMSLIVFRREPA